MASGTGFADEVGQGYGEGYTVNVTLQAGSGDESYRVVFGEIIVPVADEFAPQVIIRNGEVPEEVKKIQSKYWNL